MSTVAVAFAGGVIAIYSSLKLRRTRRSALAA